MISIKKFLSQANETEQTLMHVIRGLVKGIGQHAPSGEAEDCARFRESIGAISLALDADLSPADLLVHTGAVLKALEEHNGRATRRRHLQNTEFQNMVKMLTATVGTVSSLSETNVGRLSEIERQIASTSELDDVRTIKARLSDCLSDIKIEAARQRKQTDETIEQLSIGLEQARNQPAKAPARADLDLVTGLPVRAEAENALSEAGKAGTLAFAAVMVLDRLQILNVRFGREVGNEILVALTRLVQKHLDAKDQLYRWNATALVAILPRSSSIERVRSEFGRVMETKLEHTIQTPSRSILLPISARWSLFPMMAAPRLLYQKIDAFAASPASRD